MTRRIRGINGGRARVWWVCNRQDVRNHALFAAVVGLWLLASHFDHQDALNAERAARESAEARAVQVDEWFGPPAPPVVILLEARNRGELDNKLIEIAGYLDVQRMEKRK